MDNSQMWSWDTWVTKHHTELTTIRSRRSRLNHSGSRLLNTADQTYLNFISNDYLGLANNPKLVAALSNTAGIYGVGSTGAATMSGYSVIQDQLQLEIAAWLKFDQCLIFNSGYQLDITLYSQLTDSNTTIWFDKRCHASHIDGIRLAKQVHHNKFHSFTPNTIDNVIHKIMSETDRRHIVLSEGIFSMDGTCEYLDKLIQLRSTNDNVLLVIDNAHEVGIIGEDGAGSLTQHNIDLLIGTMGKAFGTHGGFICGSSSMISYLAQVVRGQLFTTCLPPCILAASRQSLEIIKSDEGHKLRTILAENILFFKQLCKEYGLPLLNSESNASPIQLLGFATQSKDPNMAQLNESNDLEQNIKAVTARLLEAGIYVGMICYPTVAKHTPRIRVSLNIAHTFDDIKILCEKLKDFSF